MKTKTENLNLKFNVITNYSFSSYEAAVIRKWLKENIGKPYETWATTVDINNKLGVKFREETDATFFSLKFR